MLGKSSCVLLNFIGNYTSFTVIFINYNLYNHALFNLISNVFINLSSKRVAQNSTILKYFSCFVLSINIRFTYIKLASKYLHSQSVQKPIKMNYSLWYIHSMNNNAVKHCFLNNFSFVWNYCNLPPLQYICILLPNKLYITVTSFFKKK